MHGLAGVIGGKTKAPHGEICGALLPAVLRSHFRKAEPCSEVAQRLHWILQHINAQFSQTPADDGLATLHLWTKNMGLPGLREIGLALSDGPQIATAAANASSMKGNPFVLSQAELLEILHDAF